jgi:hypothetical protein
VVRTCTTNNSLNFTVVLLSFGYAPLPWPASVARSVDTLRTSRHSQGTQSPLHPIPFSSRKLLFWLAIE